MMKGKICPASAGWSSNRAAAVHRKVGVAGGFRPRTPPYTLRADRRTPSGAGRFPAEGAAQPPPEAGIGISSRPPAGDGGRPGGTAPRRLGLAVRVACLAAASIFGPPPPSSRPSIAGPTSRGDSSRRVRARCPRTPFPAHRAALAQQLRLRHLLRAWQYVKGSIFARYFWGNIFEVLHVFESCDLQHNGSFASDILREAFHSFSGPT